MPFRKASACTHQEKYDLQKLCFGCRMVCWPQESLPLYYIGRTCVFIVSDLLEPIALNLPGLQALVEVVQDEVAVRLDFLQVGQHGILPVNG